MIGANQIVWVAQEAGLGPFRKAAVGVVIARVRELTERPHPLSRGRVDREGIALGSLPGLRAGEQGQGPGGGHQDQEKKGSEGRRNHFTVDLRVNVSACVWVVGEVYGCKCPTVYVRACVRPRACVCVRVYLDDWMRVS